MTEHEQETVVMPRKLTAENGAKAALMGEFSVPLKILQPDYFGEVDVTVVDVPVPWTTIKEIYARCVELFGCEGMSKRIEHLEKDKAALYERCLTNEEAMYEAVIKGNDSHLVKLVEQGVEKI